MVDIVSVEPALGSILKVHSHDKLSIKMGLRTSLPSGLLKPQLWTNLKHKEGPPEDWHAVGVYEIFLSIYIIK